MKWFLARIALGMVALIVAGVGLLLLRNYQMNEATLRLKEDNGPAAVERLIPLAYLGDKTAQFLLGNAYAFGWGGIKKNDDEAIYWFHRLGSFDPVVVEKCVNPAAPHELGVASRTIG